MKPIKIAIADDHKIMREGLIGIIASKPEFEVIFEAANGQELLDYLGSSHVRPDICLVDLGMPVLNGYDTLVAIKAKWKAVKVLVITMFLTDHNAVQVLSAGADGVISKDEDANTLLEALNQISSMGFYSSAYISPEIVVSAKRQNLVPVHICNKETEFLTWCVSELTYDQIASKMDISKRTVDTYREHLFSKLQVRSRAGLVIYAIQSGTVCLGK